MAEEPKDQNIFKRLKVALFKSPIDELKQASHESNLLGMNEPTGDTFPGSKDRLSFTQAEHVRQSLTANFLKNRYKKMEYSDLLSNSYEENYFKIDEQDKQEYASQMIDGLKKIGSYELHGSDLAKFAITSNILSYGINTHESGKYINLRCDDLDLVNLAYVAENLSYAVALLEGNLPPNDLGYIPDHALSLVRKDEIATDKVESAYKIIDSLNISDINLHKVYNAVVDRVEHHRPVFMNRKVRDTTMPTFFED